LLLVNLPLLASLEERSTCRELGCFLEVEDGDDFEKRFLADEAARNGFALFWVTVAGPEVEAFPCFQSETQGPLSLPALYGSTHSHVSWSGNQ